MTNDEPLATHKLLSGASVVPTRGSGRSGHVARGAALARQNKPLVYIRARRFTTCPLCAGSVTPGQIIERDGGGHKKCPPPLPWLS
jgi:hypothetical protein